MIETNYMVSCDQCDDDGELPTVVNSQDELGGTTLAGFWNHLRRVGWQKTNDKILCPACAAAYRAQRQERVEAKAKEREMERSAENLPQNYHNDSPLESFARTLNATLTKVADKSPDGE